MLLIGETNILLLMFIVVMIASCFLGRSIVISKKCLLAGLGIVFLSVIVQFFETPIFKFFYPDVYAGLKQDPSNETLLRSFVQFETIGNALLSFVTYVYVFIFFLISYQEKRIRRAIETMICFILVIFYVGNVIYYDYLYFTGGKWETHLAYHQKYGVIYVDFVNVNAVVSFILYAMTAAILYFGFYRKKICYVIKLRHRLLFVAWMLLFLLLPEYPFESEVDDLAERYRSLCQAMGIFIPLLGVVAPIMLVMFTSARAMKEKNEAQERYLEAELEYIQQYKNAQTQTRAFRKDCSSEFGLFRFRSPLLTESRLISFPRPT